MISISILNFFEIVILILRNSKNFFSSKFFCLSNDEVFDWKKDKEWRQEESQLEPVTEMGRRGGRERS